MRDRHRYGRRDLRVGRCVECRPSLSVAPAAPAPRRVGGADGDFSQWALQRLGVSRLALTRGLAPRGVGTWAPGPRLPARPARVGTRPPLWGRPPPPAQKGPGWVCFSARGSLPGGGGGGGGLLFPRCATPRRGPPPPPARGRPPPPPRRSPAV